MRSRFNLRPDQKIAISVGLQIERKGIIEFVELAKQMPEVAFIWFGYSNPYTLPKEVKGHRHQVAQFNFAGYIPRVGSALPIKWQMSIYSWRTRNRRDRLTWSISQQGEHDCIWFTCLWLFKSWRDVYKAMHLKILKCNWRTFRRWFSEFSENGYQQASLKVLKYWPAVHLWVPICRCLSTGKQSDKNSAKSFFQILKDNDKIH